MRFVFIRHGGTEISGRNSSIQGQRPVPLNEKGREESRKLGEELQRQFGDSIIRIVSSDLLRARETVDEIDRTLDVPVEYDERLREQDFGDATGQNMSDFKEEHSEVDPEKNGEKALTTKFPNGESTMDVYRRVENFLRELFERYGPELKGDEKILVITHTTPLHYVYFKAKDMDMTEKYGHLDTAEWIEVDVEVGEGKVKINPVEK
ncbi:MAG: histidine phosphatase family protein [Candidatus Aenigmatarchaeota archaeon]